MLTLPIPRDWQHQHWRTQAEITLLRTLAALVRAVQPWRSVLLWSAVAWLTGLIVGFAGMSLLSY